LVDSCGVILLVLGKSRFLKGFHSVMIVAELETRSDLLGEEAGVQIGED
jgi:hypothetical protein